MVFTPPREVDVPGWASWSESRGLISRELRGVEWAIGMSILSRYMDLLKLFPGVHSWLGKEIRRCRDFGRSID